MRNPQYFKVTSAVLLAFGLIGPAACNKEDATDVACGADIRARVNALKASAQVLTDVAGQIRLNVATACKNIAVAGGQTANVPANPTDDDVNAACTAAKAAITAKLSAAGTATLSIKPGECTVAADAQVACEGQCNVQAGCTEPDISLRCEAGKLSVECSGQCTGTATCEGSATVQANCQGTCSATCTGTCSGKCIGQCQGTCSVKNGDGSCAGTCSGTCTGQCDAQCSGTCTGKCELAANANVQCNAEARCEGTCSGTATAPRCEGTLKPPVCKADADCQADCKADAELKAECTPPSVKLVFTGTVDASFVSALEANLPALVEVGAKAELVGKAGASVVTNFTSVVQSSAACAAAVAGELKAAGEASVSITASVNVSASATASAHGGT